MLYLFSLIILLIGWFFSNQANCYAPILFGVVAFGISAVVQLVCYHSHSDDIENIEQQKEKKKIYQRKADDLLAEIKLYLIEKFPEHEQLIFDKITNNSADFLAVEYPEIKSNETFMKAVEGIVEAKSSIYSCDHRIARYEKQIRLRKRTIALTVFPILPKYKPVAEE